MNYSKLPLLSMIKNRMSYLNARQETLAQNIANADTPGYRPMDVVEPTFEETLGQTLKMQQTSAMHQGAVNVSSKEGEMGFETYKGYETTPTGNSVVLEEQMMKATETQMQHKIASDLYRKSIALIKAAFGD